MTTLEERGDVVYAAAESVHETAQKTEEARILFCDRLQALSRLLGGMSAHHSKFDMASGVLHSLSQLVWTSQISVYAASELVKKVMASVREILPRNFKKALVGKWHGNIQNVYDEQENVIAYLHKDYTKMRCTACLILDNKRRENFTTDVGAYLYLYHELEKLGYSIPPLSETEIE